MKKQTENEDALLDLCKLIIWAFRGQKTQKEIIVELASMGFSTSKLAVLLNAPSKNVSSQLIQSKKKNR